MITYDDKVSTVSNPLPDINKVTDADMNEIKNVVNENETTLGLKQPLPVSEVFTETITFDARNKFSTTTQTGAIAIALAGSGHLDNSEYQMVINGDGSSDLSISSAFNIQGVLDNTKRNILYLKYIDSTTSPMAVIYTEPLTIFIDDYSLSISVNTPNNSASLSDAGGDLDFTNGSGTDVAGSFFCWIKLNAVGISQAIMCRSSNTNGYVQFVIDTANKLNVFFQTSNVIYITKVQTTASLVSGIWTHVGFTKSAVEAHSSLTLYVNGLAVAGTGSVVGSYTGVAAGGTTKIGFQDIGTTTTGNFLVDHATFVNKVMSAAEFVEAYNGGFAFDELTTSFAADILATYRFEQNANDLSGNGHTGTIVTAVYNTSHP